MERIKELVEELEKGNSLKSERRQKDGFFIDGKEFYRIEANEREQEIADEIIEIITRR